jgi:hypothetical protein
VGKESTGTKRANEIVASSAAFGSPNLLLVHYVISCFRSLLPVSGDRDDTHCSALQYKMLIQINVQSL